MDKLLVPLREIPALIAEKRYNEALYALELTTVECLNNMALVHGQYIGSLHIAKKYFDAALKINHSSWMIYSNLAHVLNLHCWFSEAKEAILKAIEYSETPVCDCYYNAGVIFGNLGDHYSAIDYYRKALSIADKGSIKYNLGASLLATGQWEEGWKYYEARFSYEKPNKVRVRFPQPSWDGSDLAGKTILLFSEQGVGDLFQFCRFIPFVKERAKKVILECQESCASLMERNFRIKVIPRAEANWPDPPKGVDVVASVCSLPGILGIRPDNIPSEPYIKTHRRSKIKEKDFKVGICWAGNPDHANDFTRSCSFKNFELLFDLPAKFYSLQKGTMLRRWAFETVDLGEGYLDNSVADCKDWGETACVLRDLDLVISVDTGVAHLAGAMGKPVWNLIGTVHDWRWGLYPQETSPWYPTMWLVRQQTFREWSHVFLAVRRRLLEVLPPQRLQGMNGRSASTKG
jgi:tetratricopeptide (TPR) repeat protein